MGFVGILAAMSMQCVLPNYTDPETKAREPKWNSIS